MRRSAAIAFAFLALYWTSASLVACVVSGSAMTVQERECCKHMAQMCGSTHMPSSHACCKTEVRSAYTMVATGNQQPIPVLNTVAIVTMPAAPPTDRKAGVVRDHHPPGEFLPELTVLRI